MNFLSNYRYGNSISKSSGSSRLKGRPVGHSLCRDLVAHGHELRNDYTESHSECVLYSCTSRWRAIHAAKNCTKIASRREKTIGDAFHVYCTHAGAVTREWLFASRMNGIARSSDAPHLMTSQRASFARSFFRASLRVVKSLPSRLSISRWNYRQIFSKLNVAKERTV